MCKYINYDINYFGKYFIYFDIMTKYIYMIGLVLSGFNATSFFYSNTNTFDINDEVEFVKNRVESLETRICNTDNRIKVLTKKIERNNDILDKMFRNRVSGTRNNKEEFKILTARINENEKRFNGNKRRFKLLTNKTNKNVREFGRLVNAVEKLTYTVGKTTDRINKNDEELTGKIERMKNGLTTGTETKEEFKILTARINENEKRFNGNKRRLKLLTNKINKSVNAFGILANTVENLADTIGKTTERINKSESVVERLAIITEILKNKVEVLTNTLGKCIDLLKNLLQSMIGMNDICYQPVMKIS